MYRCKVCGYIHSGQYPPSDCPSCGALGERFRAMDAAEANAVIGEYTSRAMVSQGMDGIPVDDERRIRLLAFVDAEFFSPYT